MNVGRFLIFSGLVLICLGGLLLLINRLGLPLGRLPGDIKWQGKGTTFYFPVVSCILLSILGSLLLWLVNRR
ncbi:MAG: DUF2905 domain-containing protein [Bryobacteraceae bacterium]